MRPPRSYLTGEEALIVARLCGLPLRSPWHRPHEPADVDAAAITTTDHPYYLDLTRLDWWDRLRAAFARIGAWHFSRRTA